MVIMRMRTLVIARNAIIIIITTIVATSAYATLFGHILKDSISLITRIELAVESFLHYARDYTSIAVSFLIKQIEEEVVSKHKDSSSTSITYTISIQVIEDKHYTKNELITIRSKAIIEEVEGEGEESKEEKREGEYI